MTLSLETVSRRFLGVWIRPEWMEFMDWMEEMDVMVEMDDTWVKQLLEILIGVFFVVFVPSW